MKNPLVPAPYNEKQNQKAAQPRLDIHFIYNIYS